MVVKASTVANFLGRALVGGDIPLREPCSIDAPVPYGITFASIYLDHLSSLSGDSHIFVIAALDYEGKLAVPHILSDNPRLDFAKAMQRFFEKRREKGSISASAFISPGARIGADVTIGPFSVIEDDVTIGDGAFIGEHVVIKAGTIVGKECVIKAGAVIGEEGFGLAFEADGTPVRIPHFGRVILGDRVQVGVNSIISRGTLEDTVIQSGVKINDAVHIAHNVKIGANTVIAGGKISGSVYIGEGAWIAPAAVIRNKTTIGSNAFIGMGAVVTKDVQPNAVVIGNPARAIRERS